MIPTKEELNKIRISAILCDEVDDYVYLRKDDKGYYVEYAFKEGAPHDNRCLSWYDSYQENAYIRNGWVDNMSPEERKERLDWIRSNREKRIGELFCLNSFTCGFEESLDECLSERKEFWKKYHPDEPFVPENHICRVGCPAKVCMDSECKHWTYEEPVKCACWSLGEVSAPTSISIPIDMAIKFYEKGEL